MTVFFKLSDEISFTIKTIYFLVLRTTINLISTAPQYFCHAFGMHSKGPFACAIVSVPKSESIVFRRRYDSIAILIKMKRFPCKGRDPLRMAF